MTHDSSKPYRSIVITHPELGIYLGSAMGLGFWSELDSVGQIAAPTFENSEQAINYIEGWDQSDHIETYVFVEVGTRDQYYASIDELKSVGLEWLLGDMEDNANTVLEELTPMGNC